MWGDTSTSVNTHTSVNPGEGVGPPSLRRSCEKVAEQKLAVIQSMLNAKIIPLKTDGAGLPLPHTAVILGFASAPDRTAR